MSSFVPSAYLRQRGDGSSSLNTINAWGKPVNGISSALYFRRGLHTAHSGYARNCSLPINRDPQGHSTLVSRHYILLVVFPHYHIL